MMRLRFIKSALDEIEDLLQKYIQSLSAPLDSYMEEEKILVSEHFLILVDDARAGHFSILDKEQITQFYLEAEYRHLGQKIFWEIKKMQNVQMAFVLTSDRFFLSHVLDEFRNIDKQAYFFTDARRIECSNGVSLRLVQPAEKELVYAYSGDFFDRIEERIAAEQIYVATKGEAVVGFGLIVKGVLMKEYASLGMYTVESARQQGIGRSILIRLKEIVYAMGMTPVAGCWYYNHFSKKTLESAGMCSDTRLLKVHF